MFDKQDSIIFPHRLNEEKNPKSFDILKMCLQDTDPDIACVKTFDVCKSKDEYYQELMKHKLAVSFADQETWGIAMQECVFAGCLPLVPDRLSYSEMYLEEFKYDPGTDVQAVCSYMIRNYHKFLPSWQEQYNKLKKAGETAIANQKVIMDQL